MSRINRQKRSVGIRADADSISWAVVEGSNNDPVLEGEGTEKAPNAYSEAERLSWIRSQFVHILDQYKPEAVAVRYPENIALGANKDSARARCRIEGVILEVAASRNLDVVTGTLKTISKNLSGNRSAKEYLALEEFRGLDWSKYKPHVQEAILVATSILQEQ